MRFFKFVSLLLICSATSLVASAETKAKVSSAHQAAHAQIAKAKVGMDKKIVNEILKEEIIKRESDNKNTLSASLSKVLDDLLTEAKTHIGKPYSRGSKGPKAFDCSGFSSYVYNQFGIKLGASSSNQYSQGEKVSDRKELRKGDLVFFTGRRGGSRVGHVGIVVSANPETGDFKFIHASTSRGIIIDNCSGYFEGRYLGARRIMTSED